MTTISKEGLFEDFFASGLEESISPFLTPKSRKWGRHLSLKASLLAAFFLLAAFVFSLFFQQIEISNLCLLLTYFLAGIPALIATIEDLLSLRINIDILMTGAAFLSILIGSAQEGALLLVLFSLSEAMEEAVTTKAKSTLNTLKKLSPTTACVICENGEVIERSVKDIKVGTKILVKAGQLIPLDGRIIQGISSVNVSHLTGESLPISKSIGDSVASGSYNLEGSLTLEVTQTSHDSSFAKMIQLITQAQESKPKLQRWFDKFSHTYALMIIVLSIIFASLLPLFFAMPYLGPEGSIYRSLAFLIAASPCALIIALPIAYLSSINACAKKGVLLKGGLVLDALAKCSLIAFDKTGTLTQGELACLEVISLESDDLNPDIDKAIMLAAALERNVVHPIADAILKLAKEKNLTSVELKDFRVTPGQGLEGTYQSLPIYIGNPQFISTKLTTQAVQKIKRALPDLEQQGKLFTILLFKEKLFIFIFKDVLRARITTDLKNLKACGTKLVMLTGDHFYSAYSIAQEAGIDEFYAHLRPEDKLAYVEKLSQKHHLAMVGDGLNDAPALARATVGISMGKIGSSTAIEASDIVLLNDHLGILSWLIKKARSTVKIVRQNLLLALFAILFATIPALLGMIPLWLAVILHEGGTVLVGLNALRLLKK